MSKFECFIPVKPKVITQLFGVNGDYYRANGINVKGHPGIDFRASHGQPVYATHDGFAYYEVDARSGYGVVIRTTQAFDCLIDPRYSQTYLKSIYWHLVDQDKEPQFKSPITCTDANSPGQPVKAGDLIGYADNTGFSAGDHLHFAIKQVVEGDTPGSFITLNPDNGYLGSIDPTPFLNGYFAEDAQSVLANLNQQISLMQKVISLLKKIFGLQ